MLVHRGAAQYFCANSVGAIRKAKLRANAASQGQTISETTMMQASPRKTVFPPQQRTIANQYQDSRQQEYLVVERSHGDYCYGCDEHQGRHSRKGRIARWHMSRAPTSDRQHDQEEPR